MPLDAAIGQVFTPYHPGGRHGHRFRHKNQVVVLWKSLPDASIQKAKWTLYSAHQSDELRLKPKSTANFLAIKRYQRTKIVEVTKLQRSS